MNKRIKKKRKKLMHQVIISQLSVTPINSDGAIVIHIDMEDFDFEDLKLLGEIIQTFNEKGIKAFAFNNKCETMTFQDKQQLIGYFESQLQILKNE